MWTIAARYRVSLSDIFWLNGLTESSILQPGEQVVVRLAEGQPPPPTPTPQVSHFVKSGDTLLGIAFRYGLTLDELLTYNNIEISTVLQLGDELLIRPPSPTPTPIPTETPIPPTVTPSPTSTVLVVAVAPAATPTRPSIAALTMLVPTPTPPAEPPAAGQLVATGSLFAGMGILVLVGVVAAAIKRQQETF